MNLAEEQERMKERWKGRKKLIVKDKKPYKHNKYRYKYLTEAQLEKEEIAALAARTDLICLYCKENPTKASRRTGQILPCTKCQARKTYLMKYGMTLKDYSNMLSYQQGKCAICNEIMGKVHVDHCHELNHVRGLLCPSCNLLLGVCKDDQDILKNAIKYLEHNKFQINWSAPTDYGRKD